MDIFTSPKEVDEAVIGLKDCRRSKDDESTEPVWKPTTHELLIMISLAIISVMISLDATIIVTSLSDIVTDLNITATKGFWIGTSYLLSCAVTMPFTAALSDVFGRPICLISSIILFTIGTILCCVAQSLTLLLVGRSVQGIGGGGIFILGLVIFTDIVPLRFRAKYYGIIQGAWALGTCIGPLIGGVFVEHTTWRWIFYIMFPFCFIGSVTIPLLLTLKPRTESLKEKLFRVDWIGGVLFTSSSTSLLIAISWGGTQESWNSFRTILPLVLGILGIVATGLWESYGAREPLLRLNLFYCPSAFVAYAGAMIQGLLLYGLLYYVPLYFLAVKEDSPIATGTNLLPALCSLVPASVVVGSVVSRVNRFRWAIWSGWTLTTLGTGLLIHWDANTNKATWAVSLVLVGLGHGLVLNAQNFATQAIARPRDETYAAAMYAFLRSFGMAIGVGVGGSVFQNVMLIKLDQLGLPSSLAKDAESYIAVFRSLPPNSLIKHQILEAYTYGVHGVFGVYCGMAGLAGLLGLAMRHFDMNKELETEHKLAENRLSKMLNGSDSTSNDLKGSFDV